MVKMNAGTISIMMKIYWEYHNKSVYPFILHTEYEIKKDCGFFFFYIFLEKLSEVKKI